jgi:hypothetical protein
MDSKLSKLTALMSVLVTLTVLLALCCATICLGFDGTPPIGARYFMGGIAGLFTLTVVVGLVVFKQRKSHPKSS